MRNVWRKVLLLLEACYCKQLTLKRYITNIGIDMSKLHGNSDFILFLRSTYVAGRCTSFYPSSCSTERLGESMKDIVDRLIQESCHAKLEDANIISRGFCRLKNEKKHWGYYCQIQHANTLTPYLLRDNWLLLLDLCGDSIISHLLSSLSLFIQMPSGCLLQVCGRPINQLDKNTDCHCKSEIVPKCLQTNPLTLTHYRKRGNNQQLHYTNKRRKTEVEDKFVHHNFIFYSKHFKEGIPASHILNKLNASNNGARLLMQEIFQTKSKKRLPKNFERIRILMKQMLKNSKELKLLFLLRFYCGKQYSLTENMKKACNVMCERRDLADMSSTFKTLTSSSVAHRTVYRFLRAVCTKLVPKQIWGSVSNREKFFYHLLKFVCLRKHEKITITQMLTGFKISHCNWLYGTSKETCVPLSQFQWATKTVAQFFTWLLNGFIVPLLRGCFYVTEKENYRLKVFFYSKQVWKFIQKCGVKSLEGKTFQSISKDTVDWHLEAQESLGVSNMRFVPKKSALRPIVNMSKAFSTDTARQQPSSENNNEPMKYENLPINRKLENLFHVLKFESERQPCILGGSVCSFDDIHPKWLALRETLQNSIEDQKLYYIVLDLKNCFNTIDQDVLIDVIGDLLQDRQYTIRRFVTLSFVGGDVRICHRKCASTGNLNSCIVDFLFEYLKAPSTKIRNSILVDHVFYIHLHAAELMTLLKKHIYFNLVRVGRSYYRQIEGTVTH